METGNSLVNPVEAAVLAHQPISGATYTAAKLTHLITVVLYLVAGLNVAPALAGLTLKGAPWFYPLAHMASRIGDRVRRGSLLLRIVRLADSFHTGAPAQGCRTTATHPALAVDFMAAQHPKVVRRPPRARIAACAAGSPPRAGGGRRGRCCRHDGARHPLAVGRLPDPGVRHDARRRRGRRRQAHGHGWARLWHAGSAANPPARALPSPPV